MKLSEAAIPVPDAPGRLYLPNVPARLGQADGKRGGFELPLLVPVVFLSVIFGGSLYILSLGPTVRRPAMAQPPRTPLFPAGTSRRAERGQSILFPQTTAPRARGYRPTRELARRQRVRIF